jgi:ABC-type transport system involved in Fe-S cluster assembly fused permease/ATPase subunit
MCTRFALFDDCIRAVTIACRLSTIRDDDAVLVIELGQI